MDIPAVHGDEGVARVACLAWGSLLWDPRTLPLAAPFTLDGPRLPIEFSRVALDGRVTLVIDPEAPPIQTYSARLAVSTLSHAIAELGVREKIKPERRAEWIGVQTRDGSKSQFGDAPAEIRNEIDRWLGDQPLDAVVWTALPARGPSEGETFPSTEVLLSHLGRLEGTARARAEEYIRRTPRGTQTPRRVRFEKELGWTAQYQDAELSTAR